MEFFDFIDPVELEKPDEYYLKKKNLFSHKIDVYTQNSEIRDLSEYEIAILGVPEDRNSHNKGAALSPDKIRAELYRLVENETKLKIIDLGNLKQGNTYSDTYVALKEIIGYLLGNNLSIVLIGGTQDLTLPVFQAFENYQQKINLTCIDSRIDAEVDAIDLNSESYLLEILLKKKKLFKFVNVGHQAYFTEKSSIDLLSKLFHDAIRLGEIRNDLKMIEPVLRDSDIISLDIGAIRQSDAPGYFRPSPNGFYAEEACQIARYVGLGEKVRFFGIFESNARFDQNNHSAALVAQMIWYFIDGFYCRSNEIPSDNSSNFQTFIVAHEDLNEDMIFYRSQKTDRWWLEIHNPKNEDNIIVACSHNDYLTACNHEVPDIWWKTHQKTG